jgi:hypothetical protein
MTTTIIPGPDQSMSEVARILMGIAGRDREQEIESGTSPVRFEVPDDIGRQYEAFLFIRSEAASLLPQGKRVLRVARMLVEEPVVEEPVVEEPVVEEPAPPAKNAKIPRTGRNRP